MPNPKMSITFASKLEQIVQKNSSFDAGVLRVAYHGENRNKSNIERDAFQNAIPSIFNCPVVCRYDRETDSIGSHDVELVKSSTGERKFVNVTQPVGVVPESADTWFETVVEKNGEEHEYFCTDVVLWKRQEAYEKIKNDGIEKQSMEITVIDGEYSDGVYNIRSFEFNAFCLLGSAEPCFESACLEVFSMDDFKAQFALMMQDYKDAFLQVDCPKGGEVLKENEKVEFEAEEAMKTEQEEYEKEATEVPDTEDSSEKCEVVEEPEPEQEEKSEDFELASNVSEAVRSAVESYKCGDDEDERRCGCCKYWLVDYDLAKMEVYCVDTCDWKLWGFAFEMDGDNAVVDFKCGSRKKYAIVDYDDGSAAGIVESFIQDVYEAGASSNKEELDELREFKASAEAADMEAKRVEILSKFHDLDEIDAFAELSENCADLSIEELEEKCYALRGRFGTSAKFAMDEVSFAKTSRLCVEHDDGTETNPEPYGGIFTRYPPRN